MPFPNIGFRTIGASMKLVGWLHNNSFVSEIKRFHHLYAPYFGLSGANLHRTFAAIGIILTNAASAIAMIYIQNSFAALSSILLETGVTYSAISLGLINCLIPVLTFATLVSASWAISSWLSDDLSFTLGGAFINQWINNRSYYGIKFIDQKGKDINPANVLSADIAEICTTSITMATDLVGKFLHFCVGMNQLWYMSAPLVLNVLTYSITIPGYMLLAAITLSAGYTCLVSFLDKNLKVIQEKIRHRSDRFVSHLHQVEEHAEAIALKNGGNKERNGLLKNLDKVSTIFYMKRWIGVAISFVQNIGENVTYMLGLLLSAPGIIAGKLDPNNAFAVASYFSAIVNFFTWKQENTDSLVSLNVSLDRFESFKKLMKTWDTIQDDRKIEQTNQIKTFGVKNLSIRTPHGATLFDNVTFDLPVGKATVIQGPSGVGKTTLFRCLAGLWPYVQGELILPATENAEGLKVQYIPQQPYFPYRSTLVDVINYPNDTPITPENRALITSLMIKLGFKNETIQDLDKKDKWKKRLSGGEQQRIAIISAVIKQPDILFIDEGTNGLDQKTKQLTENVLKDDLKSTTIIAIDHHAEAPKNFQPFFDYKFKIKPLSQNDGDVSIKLERKAHGYT